MYLIFRFYKKPDKIGPILHVGTVIEGPSEYRSARLQRSQRRGTLLDEVLADSAVRDYSKRTFVDLQQQSQRVKRFRPKHLQQKDKKAGSRGKSEKARKMF